MGLSDSFLIGDSLCLWGLCVQLSSKPSSVTALSEPSTHKRLPFDSYLWESVNTNSYNRGACHTFAMLLRILTAFAVCSTAFSYRTYLCDQQKCTKNSTDAISSSIALDVCKLTCLPSAGLWPLPTGPSKISNEIVQVNAIDVGFTSEPSLPEETQKVLNEAQKIFLSRIHGKEEVTDDTHSLIVRVALTDTATTYYASNVSEKYTLKVTTASSDSNKVVNVDILADNFLGARHGLETLAQLIAYDDLHQRHVILKDVDIVDAPFYPHRGIALDTARSYYSVDAILGVIDGMAQNKLNSFHWHITDTHSFPYVSTNYPVFKEGSYSESQVYTPEDITKIVEYARARGVRVTPELDAPAHVGEGFIHLDPDLITCFRWEPWTKYCVEPPCGQFDVTNEKVYDVLHTIYQEWSELFKSDLFHMGGDEVNLNCWNSTNKITEWMRQNGLSLEHSGFIELWNRYQSKAYEKLQAVNPGVKPILWTNTLTAESRADKLLNPSEYIIQIWTQRSDPAIAALARKKFKLIFSTYDELYFDCGGAAWIGEGQNWCSPYVGWQKVYGHDPLAILQGQGLELTDEVKALALGSEAALWTEQNDEQTAGARLWPRSAALAERLWSRPTLTWTDVQYRMNNHRERLVRNGLRAEQLQPGWCVQNDGFCGTGAE